MTVGERIREIRKFQGLSQVEVSRRSGIHEVLFRRYESGERVPKLEALQKIAAALDVDVAFLLPSKVDTSMSILALLYNMIEDYGDIVIKNNGGTITFAPEQLGSPLLREKLTAAANAHEKLNKEEFKQWLIDYPPKIHNGKIEK